MIRVLETPSLNGQMPVTWPEGRRFAFSIFDDTDYVGMDTVPPVYEFLRNHGFLTTKTAWPLAGPAGEEGLTCEDVGYRRWVRELGRSGFEIAWHGATSGSSSREQTLAGLERFRELFGGYPLSMSNHMDSHEGIYWGRDRMTGANRAAYDMLTLFRRHGHFGGHRQGNGHFWGDLCRSRIKYVRNFVFADINTMRMCPLMPYHDPRRPFVNYWFASSEGATISSFNRRLAEAAQDRLEEEGGACIMYTHFAFGFHDGSGLNNRFVSLMKRLSRKNGWFVPVSTLLDHLLQQRGHREISDRERAALERRWLWHRVCGVRG